MENGGGDMRKLLLAICFVAVVAVVAAPAFASVQNIKISGSINSTYLFRNKFDFGATVGGNDETKQQALFITQTTLRADADLTDNISATVALINERAWGKHYIDGGSSSQLSTDVKLHLAYVTLREMLYSPLTLIVGRQSFHYGNSLIFSTAGGSTDDSGINSFASDMAAATMDAIRAILDYDPLTVEVMFAVDNQNTTDADTQSDNVYVWGLNTTYEIGDQMDSVVEAYLFAKKDKETQYTSGKKTDYIKVVGIRGSTNPIEGLNLQLEYAHQGGTKAIANNNKKRDANALQIMANYQLPVLQDYKPIVSYTFTRLSGDNNYTNGSWGNEEHYGGWDPFYEDQGSGTIWNTLFNATDCVMHSISFSANPIEDVTASLTYTNLWLDKPILNANDLDLNQPDGSSVNNVGIANKRGLGQEVDFQLSYDYTEDVQFGLNLGWFWPGNAVNKAYRDVAKQALLNVLVNF